MSRASAIFRAMRPLHWIKNIIVFAPVFFSGRGGEHRSLMLSATAFVSFCAVSSAGYMLNDIRDAEADRADERKKNRPLASGIITVNTMLKASVALAAIAALIATFIPKGTGISLALYLCATLLYTFFLKKFWPAGIAAISLGMILRIFAGAEAIEVCVSPWVLPCTFLLTSYVVAGKRIYDSGRNGNASSAALKYFFATCGLLSAALYVFYSLSGGKIAQYHTQWLFVTSIPVAAGIARYALMVLKGDNRREHFDAIVRDPAIIASLLVWIAMFLFIIY